MQQAHRCFPTINFCPTPPFSCVLVIYPLPLQTRIFPFTMAGISDMDIHLLLQPNDVFTREDIDEFLAQFWTGDDAGFHIPRATPHNLEIRTHAAALVYSCSNIYKSIAVVVIEWKVPYARLRNRIAGKKPVTQNGGNNTLLKPEETSALLYWCARQVYLG